jgi:hypothetical protein
MSNEYNNVEEIETEELSFSDKLTGAISSPSSVFGSIAKFELKTTDWLLPLVILLVGAVLFTILKFMDPEVKNSLWDTQKKNTIEQLKKENKSATEIKQVTDLMEKQKEVMSGPLGYVFMAIPILIGGVIMFFISVSIFWGLAYLIFKQRITFTGMLIAYSLPSLVPLLGMVITTILTLYFSQMIADTSLATALGFEKGPLKSILAIIDPIKLWGCYLTGIGMAKLSKSNDTTKYIVFSVGLFATFYLIIALLGFIFPGLANFGV